MIFDPARVAVGAVHLQVAQAQHKTHGATVTAEALRAAGEMPALPTEALGGGGIRAIEIRIGPFRRDEVGIGLVGIPAVRIPGPSAILAGHQARLDPASRGVCSPRSSRGLRRRQAQGLHQHCAVGESPGAVRGMGNAAVSGDGQEPLGLRAVGPGGRVDRIGHNARLNAVFAGRGEDARLAELAGECGCCGPWRGGHDFLKPAAQVANEQAS